MDDASKYYKGTFLQLVVVTFSAITLSVISAINSGANLIVISTYFTLFAFLFLLFFLISILTLSIANVKVKKEYGKGYVYGAVLHGFMLLFPFAILLLISDVFLKWNAFQTIVATSIITSASYSASDLIKLGGNRTANSTLTLILGAVFMVIFILIASSGYFK